MIKLFSKKTPKADADKVDGLHPKEIGEVGTRNFAGQFDEEYLDKIQGLEGIDIYDQMRRSDAQVKMLLTVVKNPILSASWGIEPVDDSEEEKEIAAFAEHVMFNDIGYVDGSKEKTFRQFIREALTMIDFGHSVFEIVHKVRMDHPRFGNYVGLQDLAFRSQKTIEEWYISRNGSLDAIRQCTENDHSVDVTIEGKFLLVFSNELEGANYEGISALRSIYGNHYRKNIYRKLQAIGIERGASGVPMGEIDDEIRNSGNFNEQWTAFKKMLRSFAANNQNYIAMEKGFKVSELKISHDAEKVQAAINAENIEMTKAFLANFMELGMGSGGGGSFALGSDLSDIFLSSLQTLASEIAECLERKVLKKLIRAKFGEREVYPSIKIRGINDKAGKDLAEIVKMLMEAGVIRNSDRLEAHLSSLYKLPAVEREQEDDNNNDDGNEPDPEKDDEPPKTKEKKPKSEPKDKEKIPEEKVKDNEKLHDDFESQLLAEGQVSFNVPAKSKKNAKIALELHSKYSGLRADDLVICKTILNDELSLEQVRRLAAYNRHRASYRPEMKEDNGAPDKATLSWLARGGTDSIDWAISKVIEFDDKLSDAILADQKKKTDAPEFIGRSSKELATRMREGLTESSEIFRQIILESLEEGHDRDTVFGLRMPDKTSYEVILTDYLVDISDKAQKAVLKEVNKEDAKLSDLEDLPSKTRARLLAEIALIAASHFEGIEKISYFLSLIHI